MRLFDSQTDSYDMLCIEGIGLNLNVFRGRQTLPDFRVKAPASGELQTMFVEKSVWKGHEPMLD
jgi:phenylalanyl-tRNA synthetase beta chain